MGNNYSQAPMKYKVDIVMCIDATGSMGPLLDKVKENAIHFYQDFQNTMENLKIPKHVDQLRVRVIAFRDYLADGKNAMLLSDFFVLPEQSSEFEQMIKSIQPFGGGDDPEDGLEALGFAISSKWADSDEKQRHVIVVWTDDVTHDLGFGRDPENGRKVNSRIDFETMKENAKYYPQKMAKNFDELTEWWLTKGLGSRGTDPRRLLLFAPAKGFWPIIAENWPQALLYPSEAGEGLKEKNYSAILTAIANSV